MKVLVIGNDPTIFDRNSESFGRICEYAEFFDSYHVISKSFHGAAPFHIGQFYLWPINSKYKLLWPGYAILLGKKIMREQKIDIIDAQDPGEAGFAAYFLSRASKIPFRLQIHTDVFSPYYRRVSWKELVRYWLAKFLIPRADCIRVVSERIRKSILDLRFMIHDSRIVVLPIFTDIAKFLNAKRDPETDERFKKYDFKMVAVGRFVDKEKNFFMLIDMMRDFIKICPRGLLVIVGDGPDRKNYESRIKNQGLEKCVIIEPWRNDLPSFLKSFDLYLMSSNYEGWGRTVIEAMASGLPVVMTDVGLAGEIIKNNENGMAVPVGDPSMFLKICVKMYQEEDERRRLAAAARETASQIAVYDKHAYLSHYSKVLSGCVTLPAKS